MISKNQLKYYSSLLQKKYRIRERKFIVEGKRLVEEALKCNFEGEALLIRNDYKSDFLSLISNIQKKSLQIYTLSSAEFQRISDTKTPQGIALVLRMKDYSPLEKIMDELVVGLENIADPGNLGTIFRNCDWFGIKTVILSPNCSEVHNPKVLRSSMGSFFHLKVIEDKKFYDNLFKYQNRGYQILCADLRGDNIFEMSKVNKSVVIFSNEAEGPSQELKLLASRFIKIPRIGKAESLNVASASAVILSDLTRKSLSIM